MKNVNIDIATENTDETMDEIFAIQGVIAASVTNKSGPAAGCPEFSIMISDSGMDALIAWYYGVDDIRFVDASDVEEFYEMNVS